jgi:hypothetical protein
LARFSSEKRLLVRELTALFSFVDFPTKPETLSQKSPLPPVPKGFVSRLQVARRA